MHSLPSKYWLISSGKTDKKVLTCSMIFLCRFPQVAQAFLRCKVRDSL